MPEQEWYKAAFSNLAGHPTETLAFCCMLFGGTLLFSGFEYYIATGFPGTIFVINCLVRVHSQNNERRNAELEISRLENLEGKAIQAAARKALDRRKAK